MKTAYLVFNLTNYGDGYEMAPAYKSLADAKAELKRREKTANPENDGWRIVEIDLK